MWEVVTNRGDRVATSFVVSAAGCLSEVQRPDIPGISTFDGEVHYTAAWPKDCRFYRDARRRHRHR